MSHRTHVRRRARPVAVLTALALLAGGAACASDDASPPGESGTTTTSPATTPPAGADDPTEPPPGEATGLGDPLFPELGAPGIDVQHYDVDLEIGEDLLAAGTVTLTIAATDDLEVVALDARSLEVEEVTLDGEPVPHALEDPELLVTPPAPIEEGSTFELAVTYADDGVPVEHPGKLGPGWVVEDGFSFTVNQPEATRDWLPSNDHPSDKATWRFSITPPEGMVAVANGIGTERPGDDEGGPWVWEMDDPMATYLVQVVVGDLVLEERTTPEGLRISHVVPRGHEDDLAGFLATVEEQMAFFEDTFGPYPFAVHGAAVVPAELGLALEQQGRSIYGLDSATPEVAAHELAHQWFGNSVSPITWGDLWISESLASYGEWLWSADALGDDLDERAATSLAQRPVLGGPPTADPTLEELFGFNVYDGGAAVVHVLRLEIGDDAFFTLLRRWAAENAGTSRGTEDLLALAEEVAGRDLDKWAATWLFAEDVPTELPS